jgi:PiT family inorganic phosphate transporter
MISVAGGAGMTVILATRFGFPISTTHALLGAMLGSTLLATLGSMNPAPLLNNFVLPLLLSPFAALLLAVLLHYLLNKLTFSQPLCLCVEQPDSLVLVNSSNATTVLSADLSSALIIASQTVCAERDVDVVLNFNAQRMLNSLHFCSAGAVCFARGLNDTPKMAALLLLVPDFNLQWIIIVIAVAMLLGGLFNARRVAETMSHKITPITQVQGLAANLTTALLVIFASKLGMPVSTTHVSVGALFGIGLTGGKVNTGVIASIALSWLLTLPCAALCSAVIYGISTRF